MEWSCGKEGSECRGRPETFGWSWEFENLRDRVKRMEFGAVFIWRYLDEYPFTLPHCQDHSSAFHRHTYLAYLPCLSLCAMFSCAIMPVNACSDQMSSLLVDPGVLSAEFGKASFGMMIRRDDC